MGRITEFYGTIKFIPVYGKCDPLFVQGHWTLKDNENGKPWRVWCDDGLYKNGINENICEIIRGDRVVKEEVI